MAQGDTAVAANALAAAAAEEQRRVERAWLAADAQRDWHLVQTGARFTSKVRQELVGRRFELYQPITMRLRKVPHKQLSASQRHAAEPIKRMMPVPVFGGYWFVRLSLQHDAWRELFRFAGVYGLHCAGDVPVAVPWQMVEHFRGLERGGVIPTSTLLPELFWSKGEQVRVVNGTLAGLMAWVNEDRQLGEVDESVPLKCLVDLLGQKARVELRSDQLEKL